jgi:acetyl esterase/lipase
MKRFVRWALSFLIVLVVLVVAAFKLTPWPSIAVINYMFSKGDKAANAALAKHIKPGVVERRDVAYGAGPDEKFDIYFSEGKPRPRPTIVWVHGGGFVAGSKAGIANYMKVLAGYGYTMVAVEYSSGYGSAYPTPVQQVNAAVRFLIDHAAELGIDPDHIVLAGDSAGAQISSQVALITTDSSYARRLGIPALVKPDQLVAMLLLSGAFDLSALDFHGKLGWFLRDVLWAYSGKKDFNADARFQLLSITPNVTGAFPPSFISSGNGDPLAPQAAALAHKLQALGVRTDTLFFPAARTPPLPHEYQFNLDDPAGAESLRRMLAFLDSSYERRSPQAVAASRPR